MISPPETDREVYAYSGEAVLRPEELRRAPTESFYKESGKSHDQFCDMNFYWVRHGKILAQYMSNLPLETRKLFVSDMGFAVDYLNEGSFENRRDQKIIHVQALCDMMEALTGDRRFTALAEELLQKQQERKSVVMCEYIDMLEAKGFACGA